MRAAAARRNLALRSNEADVNECLFQIWSTKLGSDAARSWGNHLIAINELEGRVRVRPPPPPFREETTNQKLTFLNRRAKEKHEFPPFFKAAVARRPSVHWGFGELSLLVEVGRFRWTGNISKELCSGLKCAAKMKCKMEASVKRDPRITAEKLAVGK